MTNSKPIPLVSLPGLTVWPILDGDGRTVLVRRVPNITGLAWPEPTAIHGEAIREQARRDAEERQKTRRRDESHD